MQNGEDFGGWGNRRVGGAAVEQFLGAGFEVRALVRRPEKGALLPVVKEPAFETDGGKSG